MAMKRRARWWLARGTNLLLVVPALLVVLSEQVLWAGARQILRGIGGLGMVRTAHLWLRLLPPYAALPVFLVPDLFSHVSEIWAAVLLTRGHVVTAAVLWVLGKGLATVILVWIYQACEPALLRVRWFARALHALVALRSRLLARVRPLATVLRERLRFAVGAPGWVGRRFRRRRQRLAAQVAWGNRPKI
ncbi:MAG: hypothetical protein KGL52_10580 [Rhodospirillales bacterium]|nr:hypothetical protein [Rhodospirillales bacterium]